MWAKPPGSCHWPNCSRVARATSGQFEYCETHAEAVRENRQALAMYAENYIERLRRDKELQKQKAEKGKATR